MNGASAGRPVTAALLTRMSIRPQVSMVRATALWHPSAVARSAPTAITVPSAASSASASSSASCWPSWQMMTRATVRQEALADRRPDPRTAARYQGDPTSRWARQGSQLTVAQFAGLLAT